MKKIRVGEIIYFETLGGKIDSMVVAEIVGDKLYDKNGSFLTNDDVIKVIRPSSQPLKQKELDKEAAWLEARSGKVVTKKLINEFINYMKGE